MSHPGHIRHFDPNFKNNWKLEDPDIQIDEIKNSTYVPQKHSIILYFFNKLKTKPLLFLKSRLKKKKKYSPEKRIYTESELKQKYIAIIKEQKARGVFEWIMIPVTWLEWKLTNKPWIVKRLAGLLVLIIGFYSLYLLNKFIGFGDKSFWGLLKVAIGVILNMILSFIVLVGLGLTFMKYK